MRDVVRAMILFKWFLEKLCIIDDIKEKQKKKTVNKVIVNHDNDEKVEADEDFKDHKEVKVEEKVEADEDFKAHKEVKANEAVKYEKKVEADEDAKAHNNVKAKKEVKVEKKVEAGETVNQNNYKVSIM